MTECERCHEREDHPVPGVYREHRDSVLCDDCEQSENEQAYERSLSDFYGGSGAVTLQERMADAYTQKARQR